MCFSYVCKYFAGLGIVISSEKYVELLLHYVVMILPLAHILSCIYVFSCVNIFFSNKLPYTALYWPLKIIINCFSNRNPFHAVL